MRLEIRGEYPADWPEIARATKEAAGWRCARCRHPFAPDGTPFLCHDCDPDRCRAVRITERGGKLTYTVHHLDGDKGNCRWWNLLASCNACHLSVQARVILERVWLFDHAEWFVPYVCGYYAHAYGGVEITRAEALADPARWLALNPAYPTVSV